MCFFQEKEKIFYFSISGLLNCSKIPHFNVLMLKVFAFDRLNISSSMLIVTQIPDIFLNPPASGRDGKSTLQNNFCCSTENSLLFIFGSNSATVSFYQAKYFKFWIFSKAKQRNSMVLHYITADSTSKRGIFHCGKVLLISAFKTFSHHSHSHMTC